MTGPMNRADKIVWLIENEVVRRTDDARRVVDALAPTAPSREQIAAVLYDAHHIKPTMDEQEAMTDAILELLEQHGWRLPDVLHEEADDDR